MEFRVNVIVAFSNNYIIGNNNKIPWLYKEDLKYFQKITTITENDLKKNIVIMGYNTYLSLNSKKLKNRINIVITNKDLNKDNNIDLYFVNSLGEAIEESKRMFLNNIAEKIFIIGGDSIYQYFFKSYYYNFLDKIYITRIYKTFEGNKFFYGIEDKFYYESIRKSDIYPEIEYQVLQYLPNFYNVEKQYLNSLKCMLRDYNNKYDIELNENIVSSFRNELILDIHLKKSFPLFSFFKEKKDKKLNKILTILSSIELNTKIDKIKDLLQFDFDLSNNVPFHSTYNFNIENNKLYCNVEQNKGNVLKDIIYNIMFTSLMVILMAKIMDLEPYIINYKCKNNYFLEKDDYIIEDIAWNVPDIGPLLILKDKDYKITNNYSLDDLIFLGL
jgi:dihydrofolate reductase